MKCSRPQCPNKIDRNGLCKKHNRAAPHGWRPAEPARVHLHRLQHRYDQITLIERTGISGLTLRSIIRGDKVNLKYHVWASIMSLPVPIRPVAGPGLLPAIGTARRIRALAAFGWPQTWIAAELGVVPQTVNYMLNAAFVTSRNAAAIADLFNQIQHQGTHPAVARASKDKGWVPPLAWDEETIDDPDAKPKLGSRAPGRFDERYDELRWLGETNDEAIANRLGVSMDSLVTMRARCIRERTLQVTA